MKNPQDPKSVEPRLSRRDLLNLLGVCGVVSASQLLGCSPQALVGPAAPAPRTGPQPKGTASPEQALLQDFLFLQLTDPHWGYSGANNPEASHTLIDAIRRINETAVVPDFIVFTGDLTQTTDDDALRRRRMKEFKSIVDELKIKTRYFIPGEHDAGPDGGMAFREIFGETHGTFEHKGVHFVLIDNVSAAGSQIGAAQLDWLTKDLAKVPLEQPVVVFAHRPLFELYPSWDWTTQDGGQAIELLSGHKNVTVFYGHIHQEHHFKTGNIEHHASRSLIFPLPAPGSVPKKAPLPWDAAARDHGLGYRDIREETGHVAIEELPFAPSATPTSSPS